MISRLKSRIDVPLLLIVLVAVFLNGYNIWTDHYVNTYYTTTVASMLQNLHNFFFGSLDSAGSVTVDKPPVAFWIQAISASIFGLHGWSVILPQVIAGICSVLLIYFLVKPSFGLGAARLGALAFALTPVAVAVSRTNNIDSMLVFTLLAGTWFLFRSIRYSSVWSLFGAFAVIGVAFNMKMLQAYMVLPAFCLLYVMAAKMNWKKKMGLLTGATALMLTISLSWAVIVDSIPEKSRPYIGSSETNSVLELAFGYNGISRLTGSHGPGGGSNGANKQQQNADSTSVSNNQKQSSATANEHMASAQGLSHGAGDGGNPAGTDGPPGGGKAGGSFGTGVKGPFRLFQSELSGQSSWLIPFVAIASVGLLAGIRKRDMTLKQKETLFWLAWLIPAMAFFSVAGFFHHYYLIMLAPPIAVLFGAGSTELFENYKIGSGWKTWLLPLAVLATAGFQWYIIHRYDDVIGAGWSIGVAAAGIAFALVLVLLKFREKGLNHAARVAGLLMLLIGPLYWAATPIVYGGNSMIPQAGPASAEGKAGMGGNPGGAVPAFNPQAEDSNGSISNQSKDSTAFNDKTGFQSTNGKPIGRPGGKQGGMDGESLDKKTLKYLKENNTGETYLFATTGYQTAAPYIIDKGESVITMGGFSGSDPVYTVKKIKALVTSGKVKYFLISDRGMRNNNGSKVTNWIKENGKEIPTEKWQTTNSGIHKGGPGGSNTLYEVTL